LWRSAASEWSFIMADPHWTTVVKDLVTTAGIIAGGVWAIYRFGLRREGETALLIDLAPSCMPYDSGKHLVWFDVTLTNKGVVRVGAKRKLRPAYQDQSETLAYSGDLLVRAVPADVPCGSQVRWFSPGVKSPAPGDIEADLLDEYERGGETDFWMEPGETYHVGTGMVLSPGNYLVMITFVGERGEGEFWRRLFPVQVPVPSSAMASRPPGKAAGPHAAPDRGGQ
jgi:hypothetical protein